jgi:hypothetical protein
LSAGRIDPGGSEPANSVSAASHWPATGNLNRPKLNPGNSAGSAASVLHVKIRELSSFFGQAAWNSAAAIQDICRALLAVDWFLHELLDQDIALKEV